jgi:serine/threonine-protein kinase
MSGQYQPRAHRRFRISVRVTRYGDVIDEWRTVNLSEGGMFVEAVTSARPGTILDVGIYLDRPGEHAEVVTDAEVVWRNSPDDAGYEPDLPPGLGLRFVDLDEEDRQILRDFLSRTDGASAPQPLPALRDVPGLPELPELPKSIGARARPGAVNAGSESLDVQANRAAAETIESTRGPADPDGTIEVTLSDFSAEEDLPEPLMSKERRAGFDAPANFNKARTMEVQTNLLSVGSILGAYRILGVLGQGGMGTVYLAEHTRVGREVALKKLHHRYTQDPAAVGRFFDEARLANQIRHEHIADITDFVSEGDDHYFVMQVLDGVTLAEEIEQHGTLPLARAIRIGLQLCDVLQAVHDAGIIHRDLKPENILLIERNGDPDFVKLLDFGIARLKQAGAAQRRTKAGQVVGTPGYIAPEHVLGAPLDHRVDIYAFGVVLYKMLVGSMPFEAEGFDALVIKQATQNAPNLAAMLSLPVSPEVEAIVVECLDRDPDIRPQSMRAIAGRLAETEKALWAPEREPLDGEIPAEEPIHSKPRRVWPGVLLVAAVAAAAAGIWLLAPRLGGRHESPGPPAAVVPPPAEPPAAVVSPPAEPPVGGRADTAPPEPEAPAATAVEPPPAAPAKKARPKKVKRKRRRRKTDNGAPAKVGDTLQERYDRGLEYLRAQKAVLAVQELEAVVAASPRHADAYRALGKAYAMLGRNVDAIRAFETYLRLRPTAKDAAKIRQVIDVHRNGGAPK